MAKITAHIIDEKDGLTLMNDVSGIRIKSKNYNLLIMSDYVPAIGEIEGECIFVTPRGEIVYKDIEAFYKHHHNDFTLLIVGDLKENIQRF